MSQLITIKNKLEQDGYVNRNWSFSQYIGRLASRIQDLEEEGYGFQPKKVGGDYYYYLVKKPGS